MKAIGAILLSFLTFGCATTGYVQDSAEIQLKGRNHVVEFHVDLSAMKDVLKLSTDNTVQREFVFTMSNMLDKQSQDIEIDGQIVTVLCYLYPDGKKTTAAYASHQCELWSSGERLLIREF